MAQECHMKLLDQKSQLSKPIQLERLKNQQMRALIKTREAQHFKTQSKDNSKAVDLKLDELPRLQAEVGAKGRVDGFEGKISALEMANQKLSAHIEDLISETEREIYGTGSTAPKFNKQDKNTKELHQSERKLLTMKQIVHPQLNPMRATPRTKTRHQTRLPPSFCDHPVATCTVTNLLAHQNEVNRRLPATTNVTLGGHLKVFEKSSNIDVYSPVQKKITGTPLTAKQKRPDTPFMKSECQNFRHDLANNLINTPPSKIEQNFPHLPICPITSTGRVNLEKSNKEASRVQCISPKCNAVKKTQRDTKEGMGYQTSKQLTPHAIKINRKTLQEEIVNNQLAIDLTRIIDKERTKIKDGNLKTQTAPYPNLYGKMAHDTCKIRSEIKEEKEANNQEGDFQRQPNTYSPRTKKSEDDCQDQDLHRLLLNLTPRSTKTNLDPSYNSSASVSPKNDDSRAWYERLPVPDVEPDIEYLDLNSGCSTESNSSENIPVKVSLSRLSPRQEYEDWIYLGDQTALMPRPVIRKSCKFVENLDNLSLTDE